MIMQDQAMWDENQLLNLDELKRKEISEVIEVAKHLSQDSKMIDSLTKIIDARYQHISNILQKSLENESINLQTVEKTSSIIEEDKEESIEIIEHQVVDSSIPSSEKSFHDNSFITNSNSDFIKSERDISSSEMFVFQNCKSQNSLDNETNEMTVPESKENSNFVLIPRSSPISDTSLQEAKEPKFSAQISSEIICELSESILFQCLEEELTPYRIHQRQISIHKDSTKIQEFVDEVIKLAELKGDEIKSIISKPLRKNPIELLARIQEDARAFPAE